MPARQPEPASASTTGGDAATCELTGPGQTAGSAAARAPPPTAAWPDGTYTFSVSDTADDSADARTWTVDTVAPTTTIDTVNPAEDAFVKARDATFFFSSNESGSGFQCKIDAGAIPRATPPVTYNGLATGPAPSA